MNTTGSRAAPIAEVLREYAAARFSGILRVDGEPCGTVYLVHGGVAACETPGAPSLEVVLLHSGAVPEPEWDAAFTAAAVTGRPMTAELISRGLVGAGEFEALQRTALADAVFALVSGRTDAWYPEATAGDYLLPLDPPARVGWLLAEAARRVQALSSFAEPPVTARDRPAPRTKRASVPGSGRDAFLALADGRRTVRDLAFATGRGLYATALELSRMRADNLVAIVPDVMGNNSGPVPGSQEDGGTVPALPQRRTDRSGKASRGGMPAAIQMLRPRAQGEARPDGTR